MIIIQNIKFYNVLEIAKQLGITPMTVRNYIKQGKLKGQRIGRPFLVSEEALKEFLNGSEAVAEQKEER
ncbi:MAG: helix-turn-helix domain-containing protein [Ignavibacteria bacterium]